MSKDLNANVQSLSEKLQSAMTLESETSTFTVPEGFYEENLPEGLTMGQVSQLQSHNADVLAAVALATGEKGVKAMADDKKLDSVSTVLKIGKDSLAATLNRSVEVSDGKGGRQQKYGYLVAKHTIDASDGGKGSLKKVRGHIYELAAGLAK